MWIFKNINGYKCLIFNSFINSVGLQILIIKIFIINQYILFIAWKSAIISIFLSVIIFEQKVYKYWHFWYPIKKNTNKASLN